jgi:hypothetical protein
MAYVITITNKKDTEFTNEAKVVLESNGYSEINTQTFLGIKPSSTIASQLKTLESYKTDKLKCSIIIYHGNVNKI